MLTWGQMPGGFFAADERIRPGCVDPRFAFETCGMIELARSFYPWGRITGAPKYADRTEEVMINHYPVTHSPDLKAIHCLTAANQPILSAAGAQLHCNNRHHDASFVGYTPPQSLLRPQLRHGVAVVHPEPVAGDLRRRAGAIHVRP